jgi:hypothetical protein
MIREISNGSSVRRGPADVTLELGYEPFASLGPLSTKLRVVWNEAAATLSGKLNRPVGESGIIVVAGFRGQDVPAQFDGRDAFVRKDALGSGAVSVTTPNDSTEWEFRLR